MKKPDYKNWVPKSMVAGLGAATAAAGLLFALFGANKKILTGTPRILCAIVFGLAAPVLLFFTLWMAILHRTFDTADPSGRGCNGIFPRRRGYVGE